MYSFSRLLSLRFNAKSYIIWLKILFWYFPADILHLLHSRLVSSSLATRLCHSIWIFDVFCKSNFPFLKRTAWVSLGNFLLLICIKTGFGLLATIASCASQKNPAGSKQVAKAWEGKDPKKRRCLKHTAASSCYCSLFSRGSTLQPGCPQRFQGCAEISCKITPRFLLWRPWNLCWATSLQCGWDQCCPSFLKERLFSTKITPFLFLFSSADEIMKYRLHIGGLEGPKICHILKELLLLLLWWSPKSIMQLNNLSLAILSIKNFFIFMSYYMWIICAKSEKFMSVQTLTNQIVFIYDWLKSQNRQN